jgi:hypothetical protein
MNFFVGKAQSQGMGVDLVETDFAEFEVFPIFYWQLGDQVLDVRVDTAFLCVDNVLELGFEGVGNSESGLAFNSASGIRLSAEL